MWRRVCLVEDIEGNFAKLTHPPNFLPELGNRRPNAWLAPTFLASTHGLALTVSWG